MMMNGIDIYHFIIIVLDSSYWVLIRTQSDIRLYNFINNHMDCDQEYVIILSRLQLPQLAHIERLNLSLTSFQVEQFIQNTKSVKNNKVNFYRQSLFVSSISQGLIFKIYQCTKEGSNELIKVFNISREQLCSVSKRAAMFHTKSQDFELVWECSTFSTQQSQEQYNQTDKEYTELMFEGNMDGQKMEQNFLTTHSALENGQQRTHHKQEDPRQSNSTDQTYYPQTPIEKNWRLKQDFHINGNIDFTYLDQPKMKKFQSQAGNQPHRKKVKSQICNQIFSGITSFLSSTKL